MKKIMILLIMVSLSACEKEVANKTIILVPNDISTIQGAINSADNYDTILVSNGTYEENINFNGKAIYLTSYYLYSLDTIDIKNTTIKGNNNSVVRFETDEDSTSIINGFTIKNGYSNIVSHLKGGGIYINKTHPTLKNLIIENNTMYHPNSQGSGGGIYCDSGSFKGINLIIRKNHCGIGSGGAGIYAKNSSIELNECLIYNNETLLSDRFGGVYFFKVNLVIQNSKLENNGQLSKFNDAFVQCTGKLLNTIINEEIVLYESNIEINNCKINKIIYTLF